jgi:hypothetical protein
MDIDRPEVHRRRIARHQEQQHPDRAGYYSPTMTDDAIRHAPDLPRLAPEK